MVGLGEWGGRISMMALPAQKKTFGLVNCRDLLGKLEWEIRTLRLATNSDVESLIYGAFNAFVTAWHLGDWVWENMTEEERKALWKDWALDKPCVKGEFIGELRGRNRNLAICREIATASKHFEVTRMPDNTVDAIVSASVDRVTAESEVEMIGDTIAPETRWILKIADGNAERPVLDVLVAAQSFWTEFIYQRKIAR